MKKFAPETTGQGSNEGTGANTPILQFFNKNVKLSGVIAALTIGVLVGRTLEVLYALL